MIEVKVKRNNSGNPIAVAVKGHALFAPHGSDIVCAAVSVLTQTIVFALEDLVGIKLPASMEEGCLLITLPAEMDSKQEEKCYLLLETMLLGLEETARAYPRYILWQDEK